MTSSPEAGAVLWQQLQDSGSIECSERQLNDLELAVTAALTPEMWRHNVPVTPYLFEPLSTKLRPGDFAGTITSVSIELCQHPETDLKKIAGRASPSNQIQGLSIRTANTVTGYGDVGSARMMAFYYLRKKHRGYSFTHDYPLQRHLTKAEWDGDARYLEIRRRLGSMAGITFGATRR